jgi:hypothetical protein
MTPDEVKPWATLTALSTFGAELAISSWFDNHLLLQQFSGFCRPEPLRRNRDTLSFAGAATPSGMLPTLEVPVELVSVAATARGQYRCAA